MIIVREPIHIKTIKEKHSSFFETMVKIVVDIEKNLLALDAEMHADIEQFLLIEGSLQENLWGANIYFDKPDYVEFTSLINIRPAQRNRSMEVIDPAVRKKMKDIVSAYILY